MDPQPDAGLLSHAARGALCVVLGLLGAACGGERDPAAPVALPALSGPTTLLRLPRGGGPVVAYTPEDLQQVDWASAGRLPPLRLPLGADLDERLVFAVDTEDHLVALDLETRAVRNDLLEDVAAATIAGDGSIYAVGPDGGVTHLLRRMPTPLRASLPGPPGHLFGALNDRLVVVTAGEDPQIVVVGYETETEPHPVPAGPAAATLWGDQVAIAADTAVVLYDSQRGEPRPGIKVGGGVRAVAFSPSGHRLYVARDRPDLLVFDRFTREELARIELTTAAERLRPDASGRWILVRPDGLDSVDVIDATTNRVLARLAGDWSSDLPLVAGPATLVLRRGADLESWDLSRAIPSRTGALEGAGRDFWTLLAWVPPARAAELAVAAESAGVVQDSAITFGVPSLPLLDAPRRVYLQVSSSQNASWARELARQLSASGFPALVRDPETPDEGFRVLLGPYPSREEAEEAGRRLGRPYFVLTDPGSGQDR